MQLRRQTNDSMGPSSFVRYKSINQGYHSSGGVIMSVACLECDREASIVKRPWPNGSYCAVGKNRIFMKVLKTG